MEFFHLACDKKTATCRLCNKTLKYFVSTTNLSQHLMCKHPIQYKAEKWQITVECELNEDQVRDSLPKASDSSSSTSRFISTTEVDRLDNEIATDGGSQVSASGSGCRLIMH